MPTSNTCHGERPERVPVFYGWWILLMGAVINGIGGGIIYHSMSVFFLPLKRDLEVSSAAISLLYGAARLEGGFEGPLVGYLINRFGARNVIIFGAALTGVGLILLSMVQSFLAFFMVYVFVVSMGSNAGFFHPVSTAVNQWFIRHRGFGFSVITASGSIGGMFMAPLLSFIILTYGWQSGAVVAGLLILAVVIPAALPIRRSPEEMGLHPDGRASAGGPGNAAAAGGRVIAESNFTIREAVRTMHFWLLLTCICLRLMVTVALNTHFVPLLVWKGLSEAASAYLLGLFAFVSVPLSIGLGWVGDRWNKARLSSLCLVPIILAMTGMVLLRGEGILYIFPIAFACSMASAPLNWALIGDYFGRGSYASLRGIMGIGYGTATFFSPIYAGWVFDRTESYTWVLLTFSVILAFAALIFAVLSPPQSPSTAKTPIAGTQGKPEP